MCSESVVFCRLLPRQKAKIVDILHTVNPQLTVAAIGDGANDVPLIRDADIGIGIAGDEGTNACNSADITVPEFEYIKRLIFTHGRMFHIRYSELYEYMLDKNSIIAFLHLIYT